MPKGEEGIGAGLLTKWNEKALMSNRFIKLGQAKTSKVTFKSCQPADGDVTLVFLHLPKTSP